MKIFVIALLVTCSLLPAQQNSSGAPASSSVALSAFGTSGQGNDDTSVIQAALNSTSVNSQTLIIRDGTYNVRPLYIPANASIVLDGFVIIQALPGLGQYEHLINIADVQNVSISGTPGQAVLSMPRAEYNFGEYRHCLAINGASNVTVNGIQCNGSGGDGVYIGGGGAQAYSSNIQILNSGFDNNRRQGLSLTAGKNILISNCTFTNTSGTSPAAGVDIEPNAPSDVLQNISIQNSSATGNDGNGLVFGIERLNASSAPVSITVSNFTSRQNKGSGFYAYNEPDNGAYSVPGSVLISDSSSTLDGQYGAVASFWDAGGTSLTFQNLTVMNANGSKTNIDNAAIAVKRGGGGSRPMGNVHFLGTSVIDTLGYIDVYFTAYDWSNVGITQLQFLNSRQLSGAKHGGLFLSGLPMFVVDVK